MSWLKSKVVILPINEKAENCLIGYSDKSLLFKYKKGYFTQEYLKSIYAQSFHLYFLSDEEIKEGDWQYTKLFGISQAKNLLWSKEEGAKKIIATTNKCLLKPYSEQTLDCFACLSQPSDSFIDVFIEEYNRGNVITDVMVEYITNEAGKYREFDAFPETDSILKVNSKDNTITIRKVKDTWTKEDLPIDIMLNLIGYIDTPVGRKKYHPDVVEQTQLLKEWINKNL